VHEAYEKLAAQDKPAWASRAHFRSAAARAMRQILVDYSRAQRAAKRGGGLARVSLDELRALDSGATFSGQHTETLLVLDESLTRLAAIDERQTRVVECRFFGGMTIQETAESLRISAATVQRDWAMAKAWLYRDMQRASGSSAEQQMGVDKGMGRTSRGGSPPLG
jgi:RNA polymerase sigma factor (TIGR02999 family)